MERERYDIKAIIVGVAISVIVTLLVTVVSYSFKMYFLLRRFPAVEDRVEDSVKQINELNNSAQVHLLGTGTTAFHSSLIKNMTIDDFQSSGMADIWLSIF